MIHSYPWYIKDWLLSETRLSMSLEERGLYRDLIDQLCEHGSLPAEREKLIRLAACDTRSFNRSFDKVRAKFYEKDGRLYHQKVDSVIAKLMEQKEKLTNRGKAGAAARHLLKQTVSSEQAQPNLAPPLPLPQPQPLPQPIGEARASAPPPAEASRVQPFDTFCAVFRGPIEDTAWRVFGQVVATPEDLEAITQNTPLWMETRAYADGFHSAIKFLRGGVWKKPPKEQPPTELAGGKLNSSVMRAAQMAFGGKR